MKKLISLLIIAAMVVCLGSCTANTEKDFDLSEQDTYSPKIISLSVVFYLSSDDYKNNNGEVYEVTDLEKIDEIIELICHANTNSVNNGSPFSFPRFVINIDFEDGNYAEIHLDKDNKFSSYGFDETIDIVADALDYYSELKHLIEQL